MTRYDLAAHIHRAELREGDVAVLGFGEISDAKYTLGGWLTGRARAHRFDETATRLWTGKIARVALPVMQAGEVEITMRLRAIRPGKLSAHVNGKLVGHYRLSGKEFEQIEIAVPPEHVVEGDNWLQLRMSSRGHVPGVGSASLAIDWLRVGPQATERDATPVPHLDQLAPQGGQALQLPTGLALGFALEVPDHARLMATAKASQPTTLDVVALRDGHPPRTVERIPLDPAAQDGSEIPIDVDLGPLAGALVRLELQSKDHDLILHQPRITAPRADVPHVATGDEPPTNLIVFLIDTLRADKLKPYAPDTRVRTPALDAFREGATVMRRARTQENWTKPSVATLLTGLMPWEHHAITGEAVLPRSAPMLSEHLQKRGYHTGAFIANGYVSGRFGFRRGWDTYRNYIREGRRNRAQYVADDVLEWLDARPQDKPFFLYIHTIDPHVPYKPPDHFLKMYDDASYAGVVDFRRDATLLENIKSGRIRLNARDKQRLMALYDAEISYHDAHFRRVMDGLAKRGLDRNTAIVITSDHGEEFWDHGSVGHGHSIWDELLHVPLILRIPGQGDTPDALDDAVGLVDVMPTVLQALGEPPPEGLAGLSFLPQLRGVPPAAPRSTVSGFMKTWRTLATGRMKLVQRGYAAAGLYDVEADPGEQQDLAESHPLGLRYLRGLLGLVLAQADGPRRDPASRRTHEAVSTTIDPETEAQLRALGYIGSSKR